MFDEYIKSRAGCPCHFEYLHRRRFSPTFPLVTAESILACVYFLVGPFFWGFLGFGIINGRGKMEILRRPSSPVPQPAPRVAVLIPAKDEAGQIEKCVSTVLGQDYPNFEVNV